MANTLISKVDFIILIITLSCSLPSVVFANPYFSRLQLPSNTLGPESIAFNSTGGLYTGVAYGKILNYQGPEKGFVTFAFSSSNSSSASCDNTTNQDLGPTCGRPLGLGFNFKTNKLYVTDAYFGLLEVNGTEGGVATQLATSAEGVPFRFLDALDIDQTTGIVYFADASSVYTLSEITRAVIANDATGRHMKYDPSTKEVTVLLRNLGGAAGVAVSEDSSFVLVTEFIAKRIQKYWLTGPRANTSQVLTTFRGRPDNVKTTAVAGNFWVAVNVEAITGVVPAGQKINGRRGTVVQTVNFEPQYNSTQISEVHEYGRGLYVGSRLVDFVGLYL